MKDEIQKLFQRSVNPFGGLYKKHKLMFRLFLPKSSIEIDSTLVLLILRPGQGLKSVESFM